MVGIGVQSGEVRRGVGREGRGWNALGCKRSIVLSGITNSGRRGKTAEKSMPPPICES